MSLVEVLIALSLSSLLAGVSWSQYLSMKHQFWHLHQQISKTLEQQSAIELLREQIRQAGFTPCGSLRHLDTGHAQSLTPIEHETAGKSGFQLHYMNAHYSQVKKVLNQSWLEVSADLTVKAKDWIIVSDCQRAERRQVLALERHFGKVRIHLDAPLRGQYGVVAFVGQWEEVSFFVRPPQGLFYKQRRTESILPDVKAMTTEILQTNRGRVLAVEFVLNAQKSMLVKTRLRTD